MRLSATLALIPALLLTSTAGAFERQDWLDDYAALKTALEQRYANLAWVASPQGGVNLPALDKRTRRLLEIAEDDAMAKAALSAFISGFRDGHLSSAGPVLQTKIAQPLALSNIDYSKLSATQACAALGYAPQRGVAFSLPFENLPGTTLEADGLTRSFRSGVVTAPDGTRLGVVRIARFRQQDASPAACMQAWAERQTKGAMGDADVKPVKEAASAAWMRTLAAQLQSFREQKVAAVLVDVGGNPGGNDSGDWATRLFTARDVHSARMLMVAAPLAIPYFDEQLGQLRAAQKEKDATPEARAMLEQSIAAFEARKAGITARGCDLSWVWNEQRPWQPYGCSRLIDAGYASGQADYLPAKAFGNKNIASSIYWAAEVDDLRGAWNGPVYVLTDGGSASSAEMFATLMQDAVGARIVGRASSGDGCGFMTDAPPVELPHSHLRYRVPNCTRLCADGSNEVAGVKPDLPIQPADGEGDRARAWRLLDAVAADLRARAAWP